MYQADDILIIGDSFCENRIKPYSWPQIVLSQLTKKEFSVDIQPRGKGFPGGAWWAYRKVLLKELKIKVPKVLIVCHTEPFRLPNDSDHGINLRSAETRILSMDNKDYKMPKPIAEASLSYYKELMCCDFYLWACDQWFKELDEICSIHNIEKVIHLYCFDGEYTNYTFNHGVTLSDSLYSYVIKIPKLFGIKGTELNHYNKAGNLSLATSIINLIENYSEQGKRLNIKLIEYGID